MKCKMTERSKQIFGNDIAPGAYKKAVRSKQKFIRKFGDDSTKIYPTSIQANPYIGPELGVSDIRVGEEGTADFNTEKGIIVGNIQNAMQKETSSKAADQILRTSALIHNHVFQ